MSSSALVRAQARRKLFLRRDLVFFSITFRKRPPGMAKPIGIERASTKVTESISCIDSASSAAPAHRLVRVDALARRLPKNWCPSPAPAACASGRPHQHFLDVCREDSSRPHLLDQLEGLLHQIHDQVSRARGRAGSGGPPACLALGTNGSSITTLLRERKVDLRRLGRVLDPLHGEGDCVRSIFVWLRNSSSTKSMMRC